MESKKIKPNLSTLNALLETLCKIDNLPNKKEIAMKTLAEFRNLGIQPSLGTYYYLFDIRCRGKMSYKYFRLEQAYFKKILDDLSSKKLEIRHKSDMFFFPYVMEICAMVLKSPLLAHALNYLLMKNDHIKFIGGNLDETLY